MKLGEIADRIGAQLVLPGVASGEEIRRIVASDRMSDLLAQAGEETLLVTRLANAHLGRIAGLMDAPAVCLVDGVSPEDELLCTAAALGTALLVSPTDLAETCRRLEGCFQGMKEPG